ncbi:MAG: IPExxxVDY family protein [Flavobacteriaceae bacterium]|nr:IPExxxVDY family protein [Flavobacteriaceae bacterium]
MTVWNLEGDFLEDPYLLFGIRTTIESFSIAFKINAVTDLLLKRRNKDGEWKPHGSVPIYDFFDKKQQCNWTLFPNKLLVEKTSIGSDLFASQIQTLWYFMVPEHKQADYLLMVDSQELSDVEGMIKAIQNVSDVVAMYRIDTEELKTTNHLMF